MKKKQILLTTIGMMLLAFCLHAQSLTTTYDNNNGSPGVSFDLTAKKTLPSIVLIFMWLLMG